ncbi:hypothetical protein JNK62_01645 [bacterium]|nr:hypothetical protein [bacterium]
MEVLIALLPNFCIGTVGIPLAVRFVGKISFLHVMVYVGIYMLAAVGVVVWFIVRYGTPEAGVGGFLLSILSTFVGLGVGVLIWMLNAEREHQQRHRSSQ